MLTFIILQMSEVTHDMTASLPGSWVSQVGYQKKAQCSVYRQVPDRSTFPGNEHHL